jgi:hypothetical protein
MKKKLALFVVAIGAAGSALATDVGVSVSVVQPGVYGRIDIGAAPPPPVVYAEPVIIAQPAVVRYQQPVYLYVPVVQQQQWAQYCGRYGACSRPVYFVQETWVKERWEHDRGRHRGHGRGHGHQKD